MQGGLMTIGEENKVNISSGILPRAADFIFKEIAKLKEIGIDYQVYFSAFEIYNEKIYDLQEKTKGGRVALKLTFTGNYVHN